MKPIEIRALAGIRNDLPASRFSPADLLRAENIELDETGKPYRRLGTELLLAGKMHSLWSDSTGVAYFVRDDVLHSYRPGGTPAPLASTTGRVRYQQAADTVFWTDGMQHGRIANGVSSRAGVPVPPPPTVTTCPGGMLDGTYLICVTNLRADGVESGASREVAVPTSGGICLDLGTAPSDVVERRIYISECDGELPLLTHSLPAATSTLTVSDAPRGTIPVRTRFMGPPPAGQAMGYFNGRLFVADGQYLWYSQPYEYELFDLISGFIPFTGRVNVIAPVSDGIFVGSDEETVFLAGADPSEFVRKQVAPYGAVLGTEREIPVMYLGEENLQAPTWMWASRKGVCLGATGGVFMDLTGGRYQLPEATSGTSLLKIRGGTPQFVTSLFA